MVGFDTIITLHTPHPTHKNSTSTRNNDPRDLKFCRQPYQANLTTIQHNFNPTIVWGGGSNILHQNSFTQKIFLPKNFYPKFFLPKYFLIQKYFLTKNFFDQKFF